jgi:hypothetical protein
VASQDSDRLYTMLKGIGDKQDINHVEVVQRLTRLETKSHTAEDCPGVGRVERQLSEHIEDSRRKSEAEGWKAWGKEIVKLVLAAGAGFAGGRH